MNNEELSSIINPGDMELWENAFAFFQMLPSFSTLFTGIVRLCWPIDAAFTPPELARRFPFDTVYKNASIKAVLYTAAVDLERHNPEKDPPLDGLTLLDLFELRELAVILMISYLDNLFKKQIDATVWKSTTREIDLQVRASVLIGSAIPAIGVARAMIVSAARVYALALFSKTDLRGYKAYLRELNKNELLFDLKYEESKWGCTHLQVASILLQAAGFGIDSAAGILVGSSSSQLLKTDEVTDEMYAWSAARQWIESLLQRESGPAALDRKGKFWPSEERLKKLQDEIDSLDGGGTPFSWRHARRETVDPAILARLSFISSSAPSETDEDEGPADDET